MPSVKLPAQICLRDAPELYCRYKTAGFVRNLCGAEDNADQRTGVVADNIAEHAHQHCGANQPRPALGYRHAGSGRWTADIGIGGDDGILKGSLEDLCRAEAEEHIHENHDRGQDEQQRGLGKDGHDVGRNAYDEQEEVNEVSTDFL